MRLPKKMNLNGYDLKINHAKKVIVNGDPCFGVYDPGHKTISLQKGMSPTQKKEVFLHEYIHFLEDIYRIKISEESVAFLSLGILKLLLDKGINFHE